MIFQRVFVSIGCALLALSARADKELNGGESFNFEGRPSLRDLVDSSTCVWVQGLGMMDQQRHMATVLEKMDKVHPLFSQLLFAEAEKVDFCLTGGDLIQVKTEDGDGLTILANAKGRQLAIRAENRIYVDNKIYEQMSDVDRAYLVIHELLHGYLPQNVPQRNMKLRSFVAYLRKVELNGTILEHFAYQTKMADLTWPTDLNLLRNFSPKSPEFAIAANPRYSEAERMQAALQLHERMMVSPSRDVRFLEKIPGYATIRDFILEEYRLFRNYVTDGNGQAALYMIESGEIPADQVYGASFDFCFVEKAREPGWNKLTNGGDFALYDRRESVLSRLDASNARPILAALVGSRHMAALKPYQVFMTLINYAPDAALLQKLLDNSAFRFDLGDIQTAYIQAEQRAYRYLEEKAKMELGQSVGIDEQAMDVERRELLQVFLTHPHTASLVASYVGLFSGEDLEAIRRGAWKTLPNPVVAHLRAKKQRDMQQAHREAATTVQNRFLDFFGIWH